MHDFKLEKGDVIIIGEGVQVTIVEVRGDRVRIGVKCVPDQTVYRAEVADAIKKKKQEESL